MDEQQQRERLLLTIKKLDQTLSCVSQLRDGVRKLFRDLAHSESPDELKKAYSENYAHVWHISLSPLKHG
jgi:hypothetical protein